MKVVINRCWGGFGLSHEAVMRYAELKGFENFRFEEGKFFSNYYYIGNDLFFSQYGIERNDPVLIQVVEELGENANGKCAELVIIEIPDDICWEVEEYDGMERVVECHRSWA